MMEYQKIINLLNDTPNEPTTSRTKNWVEINDDARGTYNTNSQIKFKTLMLKSSLCDYSDRYIFVSGTITVAALPAGGGNNSIEVVFKNCVPFTDCIDEINNTQIDNAKDMDVVMPMYNFIEHNDNYSNEGSLWQYYRDKPAFIDASGIKIFHENDNNSVLFKFKQKITREIGDGVRRDVKIMVQLKYLSSFAGNLKCH